MPLAPRPPCYQLFSSRNKYGTSQNPGTYHRSQFGPSVFMSIRKRERKDVRIGCSGDDKCMTVVGTTSH